MLFVLRGSILPTISPQLIIITLFATLVTTLHGQILDWKVSLNFVPFSLIGVSLAIFLGFRNSTSYARYWEARTLWGQVLAATRSLGRQTLTLSSNRPLARPMILHLCAFAHLLKHQLAAPTPARTSTCSWTKPTANVCCRPNTRPPWPCCWPANGWANA